MLPRQPRGRWPVLTLLVPPVALLIACQRNLEVRFDVTLDPQRPDRLTVTMLVEDPPQAGLVLKGYGPKEMLRISDLVAVSREGESHPVVSGFETVTNVRRSADRPRFEIRGPLPRAVSVRYTVAPGAREGNSHTGYTGRSYGFAGGQFAFLTGRGLFLLPDGAEGAGRIAVRFLVPEGWQAVTPWGAATAASTFLAGTAPARRGTDPPPLMTVAARWVGAGSPALPAAEHLVSAAIGLGRFRLRRFVLGGTTFTVAFDTGTAKSDEDRATAQIERAARFVHDLFGRDLGPSYVIVAFPKTPSGDEIVGEGWGTGQGQTLVPITANRLFRFAEQLIDAYVRHAPYRTEITRPDEYWLVDAIRAYYAWQAVARAGLIAPEEVMRSLAAGYLSALDLQGLQRDLERYYSTAEPRRVERETLAPFILACLDHELRAAGHGDGLDGVIHAMFRGGRARSLWSSLPEPRAGRWPEFRERHVRGGADIVPIERYYRLEPARPRPEPPAGAIARRLTLLYTGRTDGYLENCGCKVNQSGGVARRATVIERLRRDDPDAVLLDAGDSFIAPEKRSSRDFLALEEQRLYLGALDHMHYRAAAVATNELSFGPDHYRDLSGGVAVPYLAANVKAGGASLAAPWVVLRARDTRIAVIGVFEPPRGAAATSQFEENTAGLEIEDPVAWLEREVPAIRRDADLVIALGRITPATIRVVAREVPDLDMVISSESHGPTIEPAADGAIHKDDHPGFVGRLLVAYTHLTSYGLHSVRLGLDPSGRIASADFREHWLDERVPDHPVVRDTLDRFYDRVGRLAAAQENVPPLFADDPARLTGRYVGGARCAECHEAEHRQWLTTRHASAYKTLLDRHRHFQPRCVSCHVVGYGTPHGFRLGMPEQTLANVQCEVCHGPGADHVEAPSPANIRRRVPAEVCLECHNPDHSDHFVYEARLTQVTHSP